MEGSGRGPSRWTSSPLVPDNHHHATSPSDRPLRPPVTPEGTEVLRRPPGSPHSSRGSPDHVFAHPGTLKRRSGRKWGPFGKC